MDKPPKLEEIFEIRKSKRRGFGDAKSSYDVFASFYVDGSCVKKDELIAQFMLRSSAETFIKQYQEKAEKLKRKTAIA